MTDNKHPNPLDVATELRAIADVIEDRATAINNFFVVYNKIFEEARRPVMLPKSLITARQDTLERLYSIEIEWVEKT